MKKLKPKGLAVVSSKKKMNWFVPQNLKRTWDSEFSGLVQGIVEENTES